MKDFAQGERSERARDAAESVGRATGTLMNVAARPDDTRGERADAYEEHGYPWLRDRLHDRARAVGVPAEELVDSAGQVAGLTAVMNTAYTRAAD